jgi:hypothetical protein
MLTELGVPPLMAGASRALHERLADENLGRGRSSQLRATPAV